MSGVMVLRKSTNDGGSWFQYDLMADPSCGYTVLPHPTNDAIIYVGGYYRSYSGHYRPVILKTTDRGATWNKIGTSTFTQSGETIGVLECDNSSPNTVFAGSDYGLYMTSDGGTLWAKILNNVDVSAVVVDPVNSNRLYVGTRYNGVKVSTNKGVTWSDRNESLGSLKVESMSYDGVNGVLYVGTKNAGVHRLNIAAPPLTVPQPPALLAPADQAIDVPVNTTLTWDASVGATQYHVQLSTSSSFATFIVNDSTITGTTRSVGPLSLATTYYWRVRGSNVAGPGAFSSTRQFRTILAVFVENLGGQIPRGYVITQNYPNPFNPSTTIRFGIPEAADVSVKVYNILGEVVARLVSSELAAGYYSVQWNAEGLPSGIYFCRLEARGHILARKLTLLR